MRWRYTAIVWVGVLFWFFEAAWFGFNLHPGSVAEEVCDRIAATLIIFGAAANLGVLAFRLDKFLSAQEDR